MKQINKLIGETVAQSIAEPAISENCSLGFKNHVKKFGAVFVIAIGVFGLSNEANASDYQSLGIATAISSMVGMASNGSAPNNLSSVCANIQRKNGAIVAGSGFAGAALGNMGGGGTGKKLLTGFGALLGMGIGNAVEENRMTRECEVLIAQQQQQQQQQQYSQNNFPTADILYQAQTQDGKSIFVTMDSSPGLLSLSGNRQGMIDPLTSPNVYNGVKESLDMLNVSYNNLNNLSKKYLSLINGTEEEIFNPRPETNPRNDQKIAQLQSEYKKAYDVYASKRGIAAHILDEASARNYNLSEFSNAVQLFQVPQSAKLSYSSVYHKSFENRYANDIKLGNSIR